MSNCSSFLNIFSYGCTSSSKNSINIESIREDFKTSVKNSIMNNSDSIINVQNQKVRISGCTGSVNISQLQNTKTISNSTTRASVTKDLTKNFISQVKTALEAEAKKQDGFLAQAGAVETANDLNNKLTEISNEYDENNTTIIDLSEKINIQNQDVEIKNSNNCNVTQTMLYDGVATKLLEDLMTKIEEDERLTGTLSDLESKLETKTTGFDAIVASITSMGKVAYLVMGLVVIAIVGGLFFFLSKAVNPENIKAAGDAAKGFKKF